MPEPTSEILRGSQLFRRHLQARAHVVADVRAKTILLVEPGKHLRDEPEPAQREECGPARREVELQIFDMGAAIFQAERRRAANTLDGGIDADAGDIGTVRGMHASSHAGLHGGDKIASGYRLRNRRQIARPGNGLKHQRHVLRGSSHRAGHLQRVPCPIGRMCRHQSDGRPQPHDAAERCRNAQRSAEVRAFRQRDHSRDESGGAPTRRSARALRRIPRVARAAEHVVERVRAGGKLGTIGFAHDDGAGLAQPPDDERIFFWNVIGVDRRAERGAHAGHGRDILDAHRQPAQQSWIFAARQPLVQLPRVVHHSRIVRDDGVQRRVVLLYAIEAGADEIRNGHLARADAAPELRRGKIRDRAHGFQSPTNATARQNAASPPLNFHGKQPRISRLF